METGLQMLITGFFEVCLLHALQRAEAWALFQLRVLSYCRFLRSWF